MSHRTRPAVKKRRAISRASYGRLEERNLLAGNVTVFDGANLYIRGDSADNNVEIVADSIVVDGESELFVVIRGKDGTTINGKDQIEVPADGQYGLSVNYDSGIRANFGKGDDTVFIDDIFFSGESLIYGGPGADAIGAYRGGFNDVTIQTFTGDDTVALESLFLSRVGVFTLDGDDTVSINRNAFLGFNVNGGESRSLVVTGDGDDHVVHNDMGHSGESLVLTQDGADFVSVSQPKSVSTTRVFTGAGPDEVFVDLTNFDERVTNDPIFVFAGQDGEDRIEFVANDVGQRFTQLRRFEVDGIEDREQKTQTALEAGILRDVRPTDSLTKIRLSPELSTFYDALVSTDVISEIDPRTMGSIFAPTNEAFASLAEGTLESLSEDELKKVLRFHVASGATVRIEDFANGGPYDIKTLTDETFSVAKVDGELVINEQVTLAESNIFLTRSNLHTLNGVLIPSLE